MAERKTAPSWGRFSLFNPFFEIFVCDRIEK